MKSGSLHSADFLKRNQFFGDRGGEPFRVCVWHDSTRECSTQAQENTTQQDKRIKSKIEDKSQSSILKDDEEKEKKHSER